MDSGMHDAPASTIAPSRPQSTTTTTTSGPPTSPRPTDRRPLHRCPAARRRTVQDSCGSASWSIDGGGRGRSQRRACLRVISICYTTWSAASPAHASRSRPGNRLLDVDDMEIQVKRCLRCCLHTVKVKNTIASTTFVVKHPCNIGLARLKTISAIPIRPGTRQPLYAVDKLNS